jgi:1-phosphatidylinositol-4-phosphate 5-kinase
MGVIDIFTYYNAKKKAEHFFKSLKYEEMTVSCVPPEAYAKRFVEFMDKAF